MKCVQIYEPDYTLYTFQDLLFYTFHILLLCTCHKTSHLGMGTKIGFGMCVFKGLLLFGQYPVSIALYYEHILLLNIKLPNNHNNRNTVDRSLLLPVLCTVSRCYLEVKKCISQITLGLTPSYTGHC